MLKMTRQRLAFAIALAVCGAGWAQSAKPEDTEVAATRVQMTALRDAFVMATRAAGFTCPIAPPAVSVEDVPSYGNYEVDRNMVQTPAWSQMSQREKGLFYQLAGPGASDEAARTEFEIDSHHWIFVHELGHWWQACRGVSHDGSHYAKEFGANRIAAAYWRGQDPSVIAHMRAAFDQVLSHAPNPIPDGQDVEAYFDANYEKLGPTPAYPWFQSRMAIRVLDETPAPMFAQVLKRIAR